MPRVRFSKDFVLFRVLISPAKWLAVEEQLQDMGAMTQNLKELENQHQFMKKTVHTQRTLSIPPSLTMMNELSACRTPVLRFFLCLSGSTRRR
jgi:hypothetical protein